MKSGFGDFRADLVIFHSSPDFRTDFGEQMSEFQNVSDISKLLYT